MTWSKMIKIRAVKLQSNDPTLALPLKDIRGGIIARLAVAASINA